MEPRKRKRLLLTIAGTALLLVILLLLSSGERGPSYEGKRLSEWMDIYAGTGPLSERQQAQGAIQAIGTNALPFLIDWISYEPAPWRTQLGRFAERLPNGLTGGNPLERLTRFSPGAKRALAAMRAYRAIGPIAEPQLPVLVQMIQRTNSQNACWRALFAISSVGPAAIPIMTNALIQPQFAGTAWAMHCTMIMGTNARTLSPIFASQLTHTNDSIAASVAYSFAKVGPTNYLDATLLLPPLIQCLQDPRADVRRRAIFPLKTLRAAAAAALPALTNTLNDPVHDIRDAARDAITAIAGQPSE